MRITFNQNSSTNQFVPTIPNTFQPTVVVPREEEKKIITPVPKIEKTGEVNGFVVDTNDFKYVKED